jgi:hypothetical protein
MEERERERERESVCVRVCERERGGGASKWRERRNYFASQVPAYSEV